MKKLLIISSIMMVGLCSFAGTPQPKKSSEGSALKALVQEFVNAQSGKYTKKTEICLNDATLAIANDYFHAGATAQKRRTYYDETADALLMGDYGGGFATINSGYRAEGSNMEHYSYNGTGSDSSDLFTNYKKDDKNYYVVNNTTPNAFFVNLSSIASEVEDKTFVESAGKYTYTITDLSVDGNGDYNDKLLHKVQFFAAPMLLQTISGGFLNPKVITFEKVADKLEIKIYDSESDSERLNNGDLLLASASIEKGLNLL